MHLRSPFTPALSVALPTSDAAQHRGAVRSDLQDAAALGGAWWNRTDVDPISMGKPGVLSVPPLHDIKLPRAGHRPGGPTTSSAQRGTR